MSILGIDLHSDRFTVATLAVSDNGTTEKVSTYSLQGESFGKFLSSLDRNDYLLIENSGNAFWFHDQVQRRVKGCFVLDTNAARSRGNKTDKIDARHLARKLAYYLIMGERAQDLPTVCVPDQDVRELRGLFVSYALYNKTKVQLKNRIHSIFKQNGICIGRWEIVRSDFESRLDSFPLSEVWRFQILSALRALRQANEEQEGLKNLIYMCGQKRFSHEIQLLMSIRGFSPLTAIALMTDIVDIGRFANAKRFSSYLRVTPRVRSSNQTTHLGAVSRRSRPLTCTLLTQSVLQFAKAGDHMADFYRRVKVGKSAGKSRIALIHKVLVSAYYMLKKNEPYHWVEQDLYRRKLQSFEKNLERIAS